MLLQALTFFTFPSNYNPISNHPVLSFTLVFTNLVCQTFYPRLSLPWQIIFSVLCLSAELKVPNPFFTMVQNQVYYANIDKKLLLSPNVTPPEIS